MNTQSSAQLAARALYLATALVGALLVWQSPVWGLNASPGILAQVGGLGDPALQVVYVAPVAALQVIGAVLLCVGLYCLYSFDLRNRDREK